MNEPKVSVLMCAYNTEKYISEAIESILDQTFKEFEFIIVDDCSTDSTWSIICKYAAQDQRIKALRNEKNLNISKTRNKSISLATTDLIAIMDSDDVSMPTRLEKQFNFLNNNSDVAVVGGYMEIMDEKGNYISTRTYESNDAKLKQKIFRYSPISQGACMYRKSIVLSLDSYNTSGALAEDLNLWFRIGVKYKFANIQEVLLKYRFFPNSSSNSKLRQVEIKTLKMRWYAYRNLGYKPNFTDFIYNIGQLVTLYMFPSRIRIRLFELVRKYF